MKTKILHIGCGYSHLTEDYDDIEEVRLDICDWVHPDIVLDACKLKTLPKASFDGAWMSHMLEHVYEHQIQTVLTGVIHILKPDGFLYVQVPNLMYVFKSVVEDNASLDEVLYESRIGIKIRPLDVLFGCQEAVMREQVGSIEIFNQHKVGFDDRFLLNNLTTAGFMNTFMGVKGCEIKAIACKNKVPEWIKKHFKFEEPVLMKGEQVEKV